MSRDSSYSHPRDRASPSSHIGWSPSTTEWVRIRLVGANRTDLVVSECWGRVGFEDASSHEMEADDGDTDRRAFFSGLFFFFFLVSWTVGTFAKECFADGQEDEKSISRCRRSRFLFFVLVDRSFSHGRVSAKEEQDDADPFASVAASSDSDDDEVLMVASS